MEDTIEINGVAYARSQAQFDKQVEKVMDQLGDYTKDVLQTTNAIIAGGAVLSAFTNQEIKDIDIYFQNEEALTEAFVLLTRDWDNVYLGHTDKSITFSDRDTGARLQFIHFEYFETPEEVFEAFDFTVCMGAIKLSTEKQPQLVLHKDFIGDMASRTLRFNQGTRFPYISLIRTRKYQEKGYHIARGGLLAIAMACGYIPLDSWEKAKEQLGGVYGDAVEPQIDNESPFTPEALFDIISEINEPETPLAGIDTDYDRVWNRLTGTIYGTDEAKTFGKVIFGEQEKEPIKPVEELDF